MNHWNHIVILRPTRLGMLQDGPTDEEARIVGEHFAYCQSLVADGHMLLAGRSMGEPSQVVGVAIIHANSLEEAVTMANRDPAVANGVMRAEVQPYGLALLSSDPNRLG